LTLDSNIAFADGSRPAPQVTVGSTFISNAASPVSPMDFQAVPAEDIAGVLVFNTWVSVGDRHWGNYIIESTSVGPRLISIDYATCLSEHRSSPTSIGDPDLLPFARGDRNAVEACLRSLQAVTERQVRHTVGRVPGTWMASDERERLINVLML